VFWLQLTAAALAQDDDGPVPIPAPVARDVRRLCRGVEGLPECERLLVDAVREVLAGAGWEVLANEADGVLAAGPLTKRRQRAALHLGEQR
jgi:hypothetical protein